MPTIEHDPADLGTATYHFIAERHPDRFAVRSFECVEALDRPYRLTVRVEAEEEATDLMTLLGEDVLFTIQRREHLRRIPGIVERVAIVDEGTVLQSAVLSVVPALDALRHDRDTRIFQDLSVPAILREILGTALGRHGRRMETDGLDEAAYLSRDFCVQYRESTLDFVHRLMEEEGIGYFFDFSEGPERLVLFDRTLSFQRVATLDGGPVLYAQALGDLFVSEPVVRFEPCLRTTSRSVRVRDHDWTRGAPRLEAEHGPADAGFTRYEHGFHEGVTITEDQELLATLVSVAQQALIPPGIGMDIVGKIRDLGGTLLPSFTSENTAYRARIRQQLAARDAHAATGIGHVIGFQPGVTFDLVGHPTLGVDGAYYVSEVRHGTADQLGHDHSGSSYLNEFGCLPLRTEWRPARTTRKPRIYGVQTATVVGPMGMNVHTDQHGRIRVRFHWDRADPSFAGNDSCWVRTGQTWAGAGFPGFVFLPRVGMELIVTFVDGDPDRPLVTGCVYNGLNPTPIMLPLQATKSIIRTRTVPHGPGYNELSFEDAMGMEKIFLRAERDLEERVMHSHLTRVECDQINDVNRDHEHTVGRNSRISVGGSQHTFVNGEASSHVEGDLHEVVHGALHRRVNLGVTSVAEQGGHLLSAVEGDTIAHAKRRVILNQDHRNFVVLGSDDETKGVQIASDEAVGLKAGDAKVSLNEQAGALELSVGGSKITIREGLIELSVGGSKIVVTPASVQANKETFPP